MRQLKTVRRPPIYPNGAQAISPAAPSPPPPSAVLTPSIGGFGLSWSHAHRPRLKLGCRSGRDWGGGAGPPRHFRSRPVWGCGRLIRPSSTIFLSASRPSNSPISRRSARKQHHGTVQAVPRRLRAHHGEARRAQRHTVRPPVARRRGGVSGRGTTERPQGTRLQTAADSDHPRTDFRTSHRRFVMRVMQCGHARCSPMGACIHAPWPWPRGDQKIIYTHRQTATKPTYYIRGIGVGMRFRSRPVWGRGWPRQRLRAPESCRPPGPRSCQLARYPRTTPAISTASLAVLARRFRADPHEVGRIEGIGLDLWKSGASRSLQKIVGAIVGRRLELGANTYRVLVPPNPPEG